MPLVEQIISYIAPHECIGCATEGNLLCDGCVINELESIPDRCYRCLSLTRDSAVCKSCKRNSPLKYVWVATEYDGVAKQLIHAFKFERAYGGHKPVAACIKEALPYLDSSTIITHLPTATSRQRLRGYDQSQLIAREIAKLSGVRYVPLLERSGQLRQVGSTRQQRIKQMESSFRATRPSGISGQHILLIDDIVTTGASLEAAARVLKSAGAKRIDAAVFAQKH